MWRVWPDELAGGPRRLSLRFADFELETSRDTLSVYATPLPRADARLGVFSGSAAPSPITADRFVLLVLEADGMLQGTGFSFEYSSSPLSRFTDIVPAVTAADNDAAAAHATSTTPTPTQRRPAALPCSGSAEPSSTAGVIHVRGVACSWLLHAPGAVVRFLYSYGLYSYGLPSYGLNSYGLYMVVRFELLESDLQPFRDKLEVFDGGLCSYGLCSYGL